MAKVLVTCVGSGVGQSVVDSLNLVKEHKIVGLDSNRNVYAYHFCDYFFIAPSIYSIGYIDFLLDLCLKENVDLIIPGHDYELNLLSSNISKFHDKGIEILVSRPDVIQISRDKFLWYEFFTKYECPIVPTFRVSEFKKNPDKSIFPAIVKPTGGSASQGISILKGIDELDQVDNEDIIQPYLFPTKDDPNYDTISAFVDKRKFVQMSEISIQLIFSTKSEFEGIFISKNILKNGIPVHVNPINPNEFEFLDDIMTFVPVCIEKRVKGPVNIQGRITEKGLICFEMNMRFTGITGNRMQMGFNEVPFLVNDFLKLPIKKLHSYALNKYGVRQVACTTIPRENINKNSLLSIAILGAGSMLGSNFVRDLVKTKKYKKIYLICRDQSYEKYANLFIFDSIEIVKISENKEEYAYCNSDVVINFASALAFHTDSEMYDAIRFQHKQVHKLIKSNVSLVINISSQSVYDQRSNIIKSESDPIVIENTYAFQKHFAEEMFETIYSHSPSIKVISLRFSRIINTYKNDTNTYNSFFVKLIDLLKRNNKIDIPFPLNKINLLDIRDAISALMFIIFKSNWKTLPKVLNIGGENISMNDYCMKIIHLLGYEAKAELLNLSDNKTVNISSMINCDLVNSLGWNAKYTLEDIIKAIAQNLNVK